MNNKHKMVSPEMLKIKFSLLFILTVVLLFSVIYYNSVQQIQRAASIISSTAGIPILDRAFAFIDGDKYERLAETLDETDPFFIETEEKFRELRKESRCLYLYTMARTEDNVHFYIFDGEDPRSKSFSPLGSVEENHKSLGEEYLLAYETKQTHFTSMMQQSRWGRLISAYRPILNSNGDVVGILGVDFDGEEVYRAIMSNLRSQILFASVFVIAALLLYLYSSRDIEKIYEVLSITDDLTGLLNRRGFFRLAHSMLSHLRRSDDSVPVVMFMDMDALKLINDSYGHNEGDNAIRAFADILKQTMREEDIIGRISGDEFTVLSSVKERENAGQLEQRLRNAFKEYNEKKLHPYDIGCSIGWVILEEATKECFEKAIQSSDHVLYEEKLKKKKLGLSR